MKKKFQNIMVYEKNEKKIFRKGGLPAKPEYPENRECSVFFFSWFFPKIKFITSPYKKNLIKKSISDILISGSFSDSGSD